MYYNNNIKSKNCIKKLTVYHVVSRMTVKTSMMILKSNQYFIRIVYEYTKCIQCLHNIRKPPPTRPVRYNRIIYARVTDFTVYMYISLNVRTAYRD